MTTENRASREELEDLVIQTDSGARSPDNPIFLFILLGTAFMWSAFQIWTASPLPFSTGFLIFNDTQVRSIHLGLAVFLAFLAYPAFKSSPRKSIPIFDIIFAFVGAFCATYIFTYYDELSSRPGIIQSSFLRWFYPILNDIYSYFDATKPHWLPQDEAGLPSPGIDFEVAVVGMILLLEATRRSLGLPLLVISTIFLLYTIFGNAQIIPDIIRYKGASPEKIISHQWLTTEGVFGIALGVSASFVFLFVLFGALLEKAGAGNYFIQVAFSILGHLKGGPAKAAVLSSGLTGIISGSSIANTVTTGTFTIPLMKRVGFSGSKAGAIEVASSVNGQIMPPVMGAAAFLMVEYVGIKYTEVVKHAFIPAIISYIALLYMVHLEALKANMKGMEKPIKRKISQSFIIYGIVISSLLIVAGAAYYAIGAIKAVSGDNSIYVVSALLFAAYIAAIWYACKFDDLAEDDPESEIMKLPQTLPTVSTGIYFIIPIAVLIWCLMIEMLSPGLSAFWATMCMIFILLTQNPLKAFFRKTGGYKKAIISGFADFADGMVIGARNMIGIAVATAAAGIIVGTVSLTGIGQVLTEVVEVIAGGSLIMILILTALICLILGMGLPTTANYIVVASLMAKVVVDLGAANGLFVPLIAVHLFVFYFGIMADVTPPVGLASFAAAAISGDDPIRTGVQAFAYSLRTAILPFFFIFNNEIILVGVDTLMGGIWVFTYATVGILIFSSGLQGFLLVKNTIVENILLIAIAVTIFVPSIWFKAFLPKYQQEDLSNIGAVMGSIDSGSRLKLNVTAVDFDDQKTNFETYIPSSTKGETGQEKLANYGLDFGSFENDQIEVSNVKFNSQAEKTGFDTVDYDRFYITSIETPTVAPFNPKYLFIPALSLFVIIYMMQSVRRRKKIVLDNTAIA